MVVGPGTVSRDLVSRYPATEAVEACQQHVVDLLEVAHDERLSYFLAVVELCDTVYDVFHHVIAD